MKGICMNLFKSWLVERNIAHRGLTNTQFPENSLPAFENAVQNNVPIELDVQLISDGTLIVFHDKTLQRVTGKDGYVKNLTVADLDELRILGTDNKIPTISEALDVISGKVPVLIEIKSETGKIGTLEKKLWEILKHYDGEYAIQSFNPFSLEWFKNNAPSVIRGQLSSSFKGQNLGFFKRILLTRMVFNKKVSEPHFISYEAEALPNRFVKKYKNLPLIAWTVTSQDEYLKILPYCDNIIYEGFKPKV